MRCFIQFNSEYIANALFVISYLLNTLHGGRENWSSVGEKGGGVHNKKGGGGGGGGLGTAKNFKKWGGGPNKMELMVKKSKNRK